MMKELKLFGKVGEAYAFLKKHKKVVKHPGGKYGPFSSPNNTEFTNVIELRKLAKAGHARQYMHQDHKDPLTAFEFVDK